MLLWLYMMMIWSRAFDVSYLFSFWRLKIFIYIDNWTTRILMILSTKYSSACSQNRIRFFGFPYFLYIGTIISFSVYLSLFVTMKHFFVSIDPFFLFHRKRVIIPKTTKKYSFIVRIRYDVFLFVYRCEISKGFEISFRSTSFFKIFWNYVFL